WIVPRVVRKGQGLGGATPESPRAGPDPEHVREGRAFSATAWPAGRWNSYSNSKNNINSSSGGGRSSNRSSAGPVRALLTRGLSFGGHRNGSGGEAHDVGGRLKGGAGSSSRRRHLPMASTQNLGSPGPPSGP
ncbi:unnamed protein product, partial [Discosporangium mesarthrocarpum]